MNAAEVGLLPENHGVNQNATDARQYRVGEGLALDVTYNTDFSQVEVDQQQINLTRFSLFFPEKRDFFLDGANYFQFGIESDRHSPVAMPSGSRCREVAPG